MQYLIKYVYYIVIFVIISSSFCMIVSEPVNKEKTKGSLFISELKINSKTGMPNNIYFGMDVDEFEKYSDAKEYSSSTKKIVYRLEKETDTEILVGKFSFHNNKLRDIVYIYTIKDYTKVPCIDIYYSIRKYLISVYGTNYKEQVTWFDNKKHDDLTCKAIDQMDVALGIAWYRAFFIVLGSTTNSIDMRLTFTGGF